jgi:hypothetical protein
VRARDPFARDHRRAPFLLDRRGSRQIRAHRPVVVRKLRKTGCPS